MLVILFVPALFLYFLKLVEGKHVHYYLTMTVFALLGAVGANPTGLGVGPLLLVLLAISAMCQGDFRKYRGAILATAMAVVPPGLLMFFQYGANPRNLVHTGQGLVAETTNVEIYQFVFGDSPRGAAMLLLALASFYFVKPGRIQTCYKRFLLIFLALLLFPWTSMILAKMTYPTFAWRWLWILPIPLLASISIAGIYGMVHSRFNRVYAFAALSMWLFAFAFMDPRVVVSRSNNAQISWPGYKVDARRAREEGRPDHQIYLLNRQEWAIIEESWLHIPSSDRRF